MEPFETFEHAGFTCALYMDDDPQTPADWDTLGTMFSFRSREQMEGWELGDAGEAWERERPGLVVRSLRMRGELAVLFQYQDYGSSGARVLALDDDEDGIATGYIACTLERAIAECGDVDKARACLVSELGAWDALYQGAVIGFTVTDAAGEVVDSCWGFYPDDTGDGYGFVRDEARDEAEGERARRARRLVETVTGWGMAHGIAVERVDSDERADFTDAERDAGTFASFTS